MVVNFPGAGQSARKHAAMQHSGTLRCCCALLLLCTRPASALLSLVTRVRPGKCLSTQPPHGCSLRADAPASEWSCDIRNDPNCSMEKYTA